MKTIRTTLLACALTLFSGAEDSFGMGFHGGGGMRGGGFGGGGFGGGGGMRAPSGGNFGGGGMRMPSGGNFGGGNIGGGNFGGAGGFGGGNMNLGGLGNHSFDGGAGGAGGGFNRGNFSGGSIPGFSGGRNPAGNNLGDRAPGNRAPSDPGFRGNDGFNNRLTNSDLQNFLGLDSRPGAGDLGNRTGAPGDRPGNIGDRSNNIGDRTNNVRNQSGNQYNFNRTNNVNTANVGNRTDNNVRGQWADNHPEAANRINSWGNQIRDNWNDHGHGPWGGSDWWHTYHPGAGGWYYHYGWYNHPWDYWWRGATWGAVGGFIAGAAFADPVYYSYGTGGNVIYQDNSVYVNGQNMGTAEEYYQSATELATVPQDQIPQQSSDDNSNNQSASDDWLPLGTFSLSTSPEDTNPVRTLQLAVNKQGIVSGTMYNSATKQSWPVQGRVDKQTQRVAFTIGDQKGVVLETGIYNLTQPQTEVLVHYGDKQTQTDLLVRLDPPQGGGASGQSDDSGPLPSIQPN